MSATKVTTQITTHGTTCVVINLAHRGETVAAHIAPEAAVAIGEHVQYLVTELRAARRPGVSLTQMTRAAIIGARFHSEHPDEDPAVDPRVLLEVEVVGQETELAGVVLDLDEADRLAVILIRRGTQLSVDN